MSRTVRRCIATWHKHMPDYEFRLWNESNSPMEHPFVKSAYAAGKYAFVADYVRFWALYNFGGIYLDTDMYVLKSFDTLLDNRFFSAWETPESATTIGSNAIVSCGALGACALGACARDILAKYDTLVFDADHLDRFIVPRIITPILEQHNDEITIYPYDRFYPLPYKERFIMDKMKYNTADTYAVHLWNVSWGKWQARCKDRLMFVCRQVRKQALKATKAIFAGGGRIYNLLRKPCYFLGQYATNRNFGDALGLLLAKELPIGNGCVLPKRRCFGWQYNRGINLQFVGSTLADTDSQTIICGAGAVSEDTVLKECPKKILFVRGPKTRKLLMQQGIECPEIYADPALVLPHLYLPQVKKKYKIGLIPHYVDKDKKQIKRLMTQTEVHTIDILLSPTRGQHSIFSEWRPWIDELNACEVIVSSSLHGLIIADAYQIPSLWVKFGNDINGKDFKFYDYYESLGIKDIKPVDIGANDEVNAQNLYEQATKKDISSINIEQILRLLKTL
ncbi:MAG: polysaccharide pyruvyl transferase family protein [Muribaculum sp.]|nr:polysaccharide pyruvyl transferase family protein [Bacteroides sp.]MCM1442670.1 polysaccharide pyruvyl transferase family protein [Muribaculum sp.]